MCGSGFALLGWFSVMFPSWPGIAESGPSIEISRETSRFRKPPVAVNRR
jgi:hypothetical protein